MRTVPNFQLDMEVRKVLQDRYIYKKIRGYKVQLGYLSNVQSIEYVKEKTVNFVSSLFHIYFVPVK